MELRMTSLLHRTLFLPGPAGRIEALLWSVEERQGSSGPPLAAVVCHPHPLFGGTMHNKVVYQTAKTLHRFGLPVLRFNFRGVGMSEGAHDKGRGERDDVSAALDFLASEYPGVPLLLAGFSFGSWVGLQVACSDPRVREMIGLGLPVGGVGGREVSYLETCDKPKLLVSGEFDVHGPPKKLRALVEQFSPQGKQAATIAIIPGADHFFAGHFPEMDRAIAAWPQARHPDLVVGS
jgi:alpha/beta superfamily hydrolase